MINHGDLPSLFEKYRDEYMKFERVKEKRSSRADLNAFILLNELLPDKMDMISCATHDEFFLSPCVRKFCEVATEELLVSLIRSGVRYNQEEDSFSMFA